MKIHRGCVIRSIVCREKKVSDECLERQRERKSFLFALVSRITSILLELNHTQVIN